MSNPGNNLREINRTIQNVAKAYGRDPSSVRLLAVTKLQTQHSIEILLQNNHRLFGENRVQEAYSKWPALKNKYANVELHLIGHLQTNKVKDAVALFDVIQTLDSFKLATKLTKEEENQRKKLIYYIEINIGNEPQKTGVLPSEFDNFFMNLRQNYPLNIQGIMCIPPLHQEPSLYFQQMQEIARRHQISVISMGMSDDFAVALKYDATLLRIGRALFE